MSVVLCTGANYGCFVAGIVPYYTAGLHLLALHILEPYPSQSIALGLNHFISH